MRRKRRRRKHWYYITISACYVCGGTEKETYRERRYGRRPKLWRNRHELDGTYCGCMNDQFL